MDAWSEEQLKKMQAGGNGALNDFFKQYGVDKYTDIREKYNNRVAEVRRMCCVQGVSRRDIRLVAVCLLDLHSARLFVLVEDRGHSATNSTAAESRFLTRLLCSSVTPLQQRVG